MTDQLHMHMTRDDDCMSVKAPNCSIEIIRDGGSWPDDLIAFGKIICKAVETALDQAIASNLIRSDIALSKTNPHINIVLSSNQIIQGLNRDFRGKDQPTNVLSFPLGDDDVFGPLASAALGDIILAFETISAEADKDAITLEHHSAHLVVHGVLHLMGLDHQHETEAGEMEQLETKILAKMNIADPYRKCHTGDYDNQLASGE